MYTAYKHSNRVNINRATHALHKCKKGMESNKDSNLYHQDLLLETDLQIGDIIFMGENINTQGENGVVQPLPLQTALEKPQNTRSPVYQFFNWLDDVKRWKCCLCE